MKIIVRGILQKLLKDWTIRRRDDRPSDPAYYIEDCRISGSMCGWTTTVHLLISVQNSN